MKRQQSNTVHVLHVVPGLGPGGMELAMARVITGLTAAGTRHSIACLKRACRIAEYLPRETRVYCLHSRPHEAQLPARLGRLVRRIRPTVIHSRNWSAWPDMAVGRLLAWPLVPFVFSFHGQGDIDHVPLRRRLASRLLVRMTTHLFTLSEQTRRMLVSDWGWPGDRVEIIPNGVDTERFRPGPPSERSPRLVVGTVGTLRRVKNHALLIRSCAALAERGVDVELRIAGEGVEEEPLRRVGESVGFSARLELAGHVRDVPAFLRELDVFVLSSDDEQHPNALTEAMACGIASVATRVGCVDDLLDGGRCGTIVEPGDLGGIVSALETLAGDARLRQDLGAAARDRVCRQYGMDRMIAAYGEMYARLSGGGHGG